MPSGYNEETKTEAEKLGACLSGIADIEPLREMKTYPADLLEPFTRAVSIAVNIPASVFENINDRPTPIYKSVYSTANNILDEIAFKISVRLQNDGYKSLPVPASQIIDFQNQYGSVSHKAIALAAGLGWQGKNLLLVTRKYGSRIRLATVLTNAPFKPDSPVKNRCGKCMECRDACPEGAIKGINTEYHYKTRNEAVILSKCVDKLENEFARLPEINEMICGICIKVCPFGRK